jgi:hypothetical protein
LQEQCVTNYRENGNCRHHDRDEFARMLCDRCSDASCTFETCGTPAG